MMFDKGWMTSIIPIFFLIYLTDATDLYDKSEGYLHKWCSSIPDIPNAVVQRYDFKPSVAEVICNSGYRLVGDKKLTCNNSKWNLVKLPFCEQIKNEDHPPFANAGKDVVVYLPINSALLNGSGSYDDIRIASYRWWNVGSQLTVDMRGTRTPYLQLYNLEKGTYIFTLKVTDAMGQESSDMVQVTVKRGISPVSHCQENQMDCFQNGKKCIDYVHVCDGINDCERWEDEAPDMCDASGVCSVPHIAHSTFKWNELGKTGTLQCEFGYYLKGKIEKLDVRCVNQKWASSYGYGDLPPCVNDMESECGEPPVVPHTVMLRSGLNQVLYRCDERYSKKEETWICDAKEWLGRRLKCTDVKFAACQPPENIRNGYHKKISSGTLVEYIPGTQVEYVCDSTYQLLGNPIIECLKDFTWSLHQPMCKKSSSLEGSYCPPISPIPNGQCRCNPKKDLCFCEPIYSSMKVECSCNSGYKLIGNQVLRCTNRGVWDHNQPTCISLDRVAINTEGNSADPTRMNTLAVVIATACSVLGILLLIMVVMIVRRRKPRPRHYHQVGVPPPYTRVHGSSFDELDRVALIGYDAARLPTYEEAVRSNSSSSGIQRAHGPSEVQVSSEFRPLPSIPNVVRSNNAQNNDIHSVHSNRHSITTMSTVNRDGISEVFGSIDTVNYSLSDASTSVTVDTLDSSSSRPSHGSGTATAGSVNTSQENIVTEEAPLLENDTNMFEDRVEDLEIKDEDKE